MLTHVAPDPYEKLGMLADATRFEPAGNEPLTEAPPRPIPRRPKPLPCVTEVTTPAGKKPIVKAMLTTACERNCFYCPFRAGRTKTERVTFYPDELASVYLKIQRARLADGIFLSSGIVNGGPSTQDKLIDTAEILRRKYGYRGYIHLKIMPGAEFDQVRRSMQLADRVSINLEGPTPQRLASLAPKKDYWQELFQRIQWISALRREEQLRASVVTQFVVGAVGDTDLELLQVSERLFTDLGLKRTYFSAFHPIADTPFEELAAVAPLRQFRLYQASFLLRDYGWNFEDFAFQSDANLPLTIDPKLAWAREFLTIAPVEVNLAQRSDLLRVPGIGPETADAILRARRQSTLTDLTHLRAAGMRDVSRAAPFILLNGRRPAEQLALF